METTLVGNISRSGIAKEKKISEIEDTMDAVKYETQKKLEEKNIASVNHGQLQMALHISNWCS